MDVVALAQHGIQYAVATLGTATSATQISKLFRIVPELIFCYDGDAAGKKAAWRALENSLSVLRDGVQARFLFLPDGEDPDTLINKITDGVFKDLLINQLSKTIGLSSHNLQRHIPDADSQPQTYLQKNNNRKPTSAKHQINTTPIRMAIALLLQHPALAKECAIPDTLRSAEMPGLSLLIKIHNTPLFC